MSSYHVACTFTLLLTLSAVGNGQDVVRLNTGAVLEGTIIEEADEFVVIAFAGGSMQLRRSQISEITIGPDAVGGDAASSLRALSRFQDHEDFHFLYRDGKRVGYRTLFLRRELRDGTPGYTLTDRMVFVAAPGGDADVDLTTVEFVDADLEPRGFEHRMSSGRSGRVVKGRRDGLTLRTRDDRGGRLYEGTALLRPGTQFPGMLLRRLAGEPPTTTTDRPHQVFRPRDMTFAEVTVDRVPERITLRGRVRDVLVFRRRAGPRELVTWFDMSGHVVREELGTTHLVSLRAPKNEVLAFARGEEAPEHADLALELIDEGHGVRMLRPDLAWESASGGQDGVVFSLLRPGLRATVDVLRFDDPETGVTEEGLTMGLLSQMERSSEDFRVAVSAAPSLNEAGRLVFEATCRRRGVTIRTLGAVISGDDARAFAVLCAAPEAEFPRARPAFLELLASVELLSSESQQPGPFELAGEAHPVGN